MKNFSSVYINNHKILETTRIGFEFEFYSKVDYHKLLELLNLEFNPVKIHGFTRYHTKFSLSENDFKIEPDNSGGDDMVELVTFYLPYHDAKILLLRALKFLQKWAITTDLCACQFNISFDPTKTNKQICNLNILKLILNFKEGPIYKDFPDRMDNIYAKSIKRIIPYKQFDYVQAGISSLQNNLMLPGTKYYGINFSKIGQGNYLEYRYLGGTDYQFKTSQIMSHMDDFIIYLWNNIDAALDEQDLDKLNNYLTVHIEQFKNFSNLDTFLNKFPNITLMVDQNQEYDILKSFWSNIYEKVYDFISNTKDVNKAIINWDTTRNRLEIVDSDFLILFPIKELDIIDCSIRSGELYSVTCVKCDIKQTHFYNSKIYDSDIDQCKIMDTSTYNCELRNVFYNGGEFNSIMYSGIFRKGRVGKNAKFSKNVKFVNKKSNYFKPATSGIVAPNIPNTGDIKKLPIKKK